MSLTTLGSEPQPNLAWTFESSNVDYVTNLSPSSQVSPGPAQLQGSAVLTNTAPTSNTAVYFPGTSGSYMNLGSSSPTNFNYSTSNIFVEAWVNFVSFSTNPMIYERYTQALFTDINFFGDTGGNKLSVVMKDGTTSINYTASNTFSMSTGAWYHVSFSYDAGAKNATVFINGWPGTTVTLPNPVRYTNTIPTMIGGNDAQSNHNLYIRDLRVVQGGVVPTTSFTPAAAPFSYALPSYVTGSGSTVFTLLGQFITYNPSGKYGSSLRIQNYSVTSPSTYIDYPLASSITVDSGVTISSWVRGLSLPSTSEGYFFCFKGSASNYTVYCGYNSASNMFMQFYDGTFHGTNLVNPIVLGTWYHVVTVIKNGVVNNYLNGSLIGSPTYTPSGVTLNTSFRLGAAYTYSGLNCEIDDLRVYNTALTAAQVQSIYTQGGAPASQFRSVPQPTLAWQFEGSTAPYIGSATAVASGTSAYVSGKYSQALNIQNPTGSSNLVTWTFGSSYPADSGFTYTFWTNFTITASAQTIFSIYNSSTQNPLRFLLDNTGKILLQFTDTVGNKNVTLSASTAGTWYHLAAVVLNGTVSIYLNGSLWAQQLSYVYPSGITFNTAVFGYYGGYSLVNGSVDDLRIYNTALSSAQVQSIYAAQGMPSRGVQVKTAAAYSVNDYSPSPLTLSTYGGTSTSNVNSPFTASLDGSIENLAFTGIPSTVSKTNFNFWGSNCFIEFWMYLSGTNSGNPRIIEKGNYPTQEYAIYMNPSSGGYYLKFSYGSNFPFAFQFVPGTWNHYSFSYNYATQTLYGSFNGTVSGGGITTGYPYNSGTSTKLYPSGSGYVIDISNLRIVTGATTLPYISNFTPPTAPLTNYPTGTTALLLRSVSPGTPLTGTPLFSQLSSAATSSAVGAFSLRAVNGTTAKAVRVQARGAFPPGFTGGTQAGNQWTQALSGYSGVLSVMNGSYTCNCSSWQDGQPWKAFDNNTSTWWENAYGTQSGYGGVGAGGSNSYNGSYTTTVSGSSVGGEWLQIQLPTAIVLNSYSMYARSSWSFRMPYQFVIAGSNDGTTWTTVDTQNGINTWSGQTPITFTTSSTTPWLYFRLITQAIQGNGTSNQDLNIGQWTLNGSNASWNTDFWADRLGNLLTAPVTGQTLANWLGSATGYVTTWYDQSGKGNHATQATAANQPVIQKATKGPGYSCLFNGTTNYLNFGSSTIFNATNYSVCGVTVRNSSATQLYHVGSNGANATRQTLSVGWLNGFGFILNEGSYATSVSVPAYSAGSEPVAYDFGMFSQTSGIYPYSWRAGTLYSAGNSGLVLPLSNAGNGIIGATVGGGTPYGYFSGEMYEILVFTSSLFDLSGSSPGQLSPTPSLLTQIYNNQLNYTGT